MTRAASAVALALLLSSPGGAAAEDALDVTVQGDPLGAPGRRDATAASTTVPRSRLEAPGASAADVLAEVPGVQVARTGAASDLATASIRGTTSAETPVYLAGVRINDDVTGTADLSRIPLWMIERVEVYRGSAPVDADRLGLGGAIFFEPLTPRTPNVRAGAEAGSFGERAVWAGGASGDAHVGALAAVRVASATNDYPYVDDKGTRFDTSDDVVRLRQNADVHDVDAWTIGRVSFGDGGSDGSSDGGVTAVANAFHREQGVTGLGVVPARAARADVQRFLLGVTARTACSREGLSRCRLELVTEGVASEQTLTDPLLELGLLSSRVAEAGRRVGETARVTLRATNAIALAVSVSEEIESLAIDGGPAAVRARRSTSRAAAQASFDATSRLELVALGAVGCDATSGPPDPSATSGSRAACDAFEPSARAGAKVHALDGLDVFGNLGRYVRVPSLGELYGTSAAVRGNPALAPETGVTTDLGARLFGAGERFAASLEVVGFARFASNLVAYQESGLGVVRPYNVGSARVVGIESRLAARAWETVKAELALTSQDPRDTSAGRTEVRDLLPFQARLVAAPSLELYRDRLCSALDRASILARFSYRASRVADSAGLIVLPAESELDLELSLFEFGRRLAERLSLTDVLDTRNFDVLGLPLPGRAIHASLEATW